MSLSDSQMEQIWTDMEDLVIKTLLLSLDELRAEFKETAKTMYNCYKLLGYDILLDAELKAHLIEVNARPQLKDDILDKAVNRPMVKRNPVYTRYFFLTKKFHALCLNF